MSRSIAVYGAYGHTGRFVVQELLKGGWTPVLAGRDAAKLATLGAEFPNLPARVAPIDDSSALDRALAGTVAVINCAGPFAITAPALIEAALRAKTPYLDIAAEIEANLDSLANYRDRAHEAGIVVLPAMAFFGGLGDLLATAAVGDWSTVDELTIAYGLSSWLPTAGTRTAGQVSRERRGGRRIVFSRGKREYRDQPAPPGEWSFPPPLGKQAVATEFTMADTATIAHHIPVSELNSYMTLAAVGDLINPESSPPQPADSGGRSSQTFVVDILARSGDLIRRATASGRDIYAVSAPLVVAALHRILEGSDIAPGVYTAGELFDAREFLQSLSPEPLSVQFSLEGEKHVLES